ncbi:MAG: hypothetical protein PHH16_01895 [Candidatus Gracilibacteria bacterium]|nr:hypothetical protein [Candidatus Gracilibacteria bacterium]
MTPLQEHDIELKLKEIQDSTRVFKGLLRGGVNAKSPDSYMVIQRINNEYNALKIKVQILNALKNNSANILRISTALSFRISSVLENTNLYIGKYEQVLRRDLVLDGDILVLAGKIG